MIKENTYIIQVEGKDLIENKGLDIKNANKKKYKATLDYSLECLQLEKVVKSVYKEYEDKQNIFYVHDGKQYTDAIVSVTFKYNTDKLTTKKIRDNLYENGFIFNKNKMVRFKRSSGSSRIGKCLFIREDLYNDMMEWSYMGLEFSEADEVDLAALEAYIALTTSSIIDTIHIDPKGILLIDDFESVFKDEAMITKIKKANGKDRLVTKKDNIEIHNKIWDGQSLLDRSIFGTATNKDIFWVNKKYADKGFLLLRNRFLKTAAFNTNIQQFFKDNNITAIEQLNGTTLATDISQICMITTPSSIKYLKFAEKEEGFKKYINQLEPEFGVVKYDKPTHFFNGDMVQCHYQLINTLQMNKDTMQKFLQPTFDYIKLLKNDINVFRKHLKMNLGDTAEEKELNNTNDMMFSLLELNNDITKTKVFQDFRDDAIDSFVKNVRKGHVLVHGNYSVLFGNPVEMLCASIKDIKNKYATLHKNEIYNTNFDFNNELLGCRSPHVTMGNLALLKNTECPTIKHYFNLSNQIVCVNSIGENLLERLSSSDFDSDQLILTDNSYLLEAMKKNYNNFLVPTSNVEAEKVYRAITAKEKCNLDIKTAVNKIGEIINCSQMLNSKLWDMINSEKYLVDSKEVQELYAIISKLDVMSCIEIDKAKKEFTVNNVLELKEIREKWTDHIVVNKDTYKPANKKISDLFLEMVALRKDGQDIKDFEAKYGLDKYKLTIVRPLFMHYVEKKEYKNARYYYKNYNCGMDLLEEIITENIPQIRKRRNGKKLNDTKDLLQLIDKKNMKLTDADRKQINTLIEKCEELKKECDAIWKNENIESKEKWKKCEEKKLEISNHYKDNIKKETMYKIIHTLSKTNDYDHIARKLLTILFKSNSKQFLEIFKDKKEMLPRLKRINNKYITENKKIIKLYDISFQIAE